MRKSLIILGGGGHCLSLLDLLDSDPEQIDVKIIDPMHQKGDLIGDTPVVSSSDAYLESISCSDALLMVGLGFLGKSQRRFQLYQFGVRSGFSFAKLVSRTAFVSESSIIGNGSSIHHKVVVGPTVKVGQNVIINTGSILEHGVDVGDHSHVSTGVILNGDVSVGQGVFIGSGSIVFQGVSIPDGTIVPAGSILRD